MTQKAEGNEKLKSLSDAFLALDAREQEQALTILRALKCAQTYGRPKKPSKSPQ